MLTSKEIAEQAERILSGKVQNFADRALLIVKKEKVSLLKAIGWVLNYEGISTKFHRERRVAYKKLICEECTRRAMIKVQREKDLADKLAESQKMAFEPSLFGKSKLIRVRRNLREPITPIPATEKSNRKPRKKQRGPWTPPLFPL